MEGALLIILIILILFFIIIYKSFQNSIQNDELKRIEKENKERLRRLQETRDKTRLKNLLKTLLPIIIEHNNKVRNLFEFKSGYLNFKKLNINLSNSKQLYTEIRNINNYRHLLSTSQLNEFDFFLSIHEKSSELRSERNAKFIQYELIENNEFFSNIDNVSLDDQQRLAIIKDEDNNLVIAGAGSGKTTTVTGKVAYLINRYKIKPEEILLITFTKKACEEMRDRIKSKMNIPVEVYTFHSLGKKIIGAATQKMPSVVDNNDFNKIFSKILNHLKSNKDYLSLIIKFLTEYRVEFKEGNDFKNHGEHIKYLKSNKLESYKKIPSINDGKITMLREKCKSLEEVLIANYLFLNDIKYEYEKEYKFITADKKHSQYRPDFYLVDYDIYIEHLGFIDRDKNVPNWFSNDNFLSAKEKYNNDYNWKKDTHRKYNTTLIETYSYENKEGVLLENLEKKLKQHDVEIKPLSNDQIWKILNENAKAEITSFENLIITFLNLYKANNKSLIDINNEISTMSKLMDRNRANLFISIFTPILESYNAELREMNYIDFSDMINSATKLIKQRKYTHNYKYIIIDEFQDTSFSRFNLIKSILETNDSTKLFAVGDDWQSIYRFAGSDISLFTQFESYFGVTETSKIEKTYRFSDQMIEISSKFIMENPEQKTKQLKATKHSQTTPLGVYKSSYNNDVNLFIKILDEINSQILDIEKTPSIIALGRYANLIEHYENDIKNFKVTLDKATSRKIITCKKYPKLKVEFMTAHKAKGLQADYTIILNCVSGNYGFPSEQSDDPLLSLLLSKADQFPNGEERRLFYVSLTRAKIKTFIITNSNYESKFVSEIESINSSNIKVCPRCNDGRLVKRVVTISDE